MATDTGTAGVRVLLRAPALPRRVWGATAVLSGVGAALAAPEWVPAAWTREDGPIEWAGFAAFAAGSLLAFVAASRLRREQRAALAAVILGVVLFVAAGEEISWGQRLFGIDTPPALVDGNRQDELNLHNVDGLQQKAVIAQLAVAAAGLLLPWVARRRWARSGVPFFAGYVMYRCARGVSAVVGWGPAGRNAEAAELVLALGLLALTIGLIREVRWARRAPRPATGSLLSDRLDRADAPPVLGRSLRPSDGQIARARSTTRVGDHQDPAATAPR